MQSLAGRFLACICTAGAFASIAAAGSPSHAAFVTRADSICKTANAKANALLAPTSRSTTVTYLVETIAIVQRSRMATLALAAPAADRPLIRAETNAVVKELAFLRKAKADVVSDNPTGYQADVGKAKAFHDTGVVFAKKLGLKSCEA